MDYQNPIKTRVELWLRIVGADSISPHLLPVQEESSLSVQATFNMAAQPWVTEALPPLKV